MENLTRATLVMVQGIDGPVIIVEETRRDTFEKIETCSSLDRNAVREHSQVFKLDGSGGVQFKIELKSREAASRLTVGKVAELVFFPKDGQGGYFAGFRDVPVA